ncbi:MAG: hypothetical protein IT544_00485 [Rhodobacteraceae bacterium]|jgi:hypothetical protein|nr:hypothetical protein [Paracoccaceae bacterium]
MIVIATAKGYYAGKVREPGETFGLRDDADFSEVWMKTSDAAQASSVKKNGEAAYTTQETEVVPPADPAPTVDPVTGDEI